MSETLTQHLARCEREYVAALMDRHCWNVSAAAREAGRGRTDFYRVLKRLGLRPPPKYKRYGVADLRGFLARRAA